MKSNCRFSLIKLPLLLLTLGLAANSAYALNTAPTFVAGTSSLNISQNATATDITGLLPVSDNDVGQTETWSQSSPPSHGTLSFTGATAPSGSANIPASGTITYTPTSGFAGTDSFVVQVSDGTDTATRAINVGVTPTAPSAPDLAAASDTGTSSTDNITGATSLNFSGTGAAALSTVSVFLDKNANGVYNAGTDPVATVAADGSGIWAVTGLSTAGVPDGTYNVYAFATSATGALTGPHGAALSITLDTTPPTVASVGVPANATYVAGQTLNFTVTYSENVVVNTGGGTPSLAVTLDTGGAVQATYLSGSGTPTLTFRYTVAGGNADPTGIAVASSITLNGGTIKDATGNNAAITGLGFASTSSVFVDAIAPAVASINRQLPAGPATNASSLVYRVTFSENVTGVDSTDFALTATGTSAGTVSSVAPVSASTYDVTVTSVTGNGTLRLDLKNAGTGIADIAGNPIGGGFTTGQTYTTDTVAPALNTIRRQAPTTVITAATSVTYRLTFSESVGGVDVSDFTLTTVTGNATGTIASVSAASGTIIDVTVNSIAGIGSLRLDLKATGTGIVDSAGNAIAGGGFTTGDVYVYAAGATSTFDTTALAPAAAPVVSGSLGQALAQRFTSAAAGPLALTTVTAFLTSATSAPSAVVTINADNAGQPSTSIVATLTNPSALVPNQLNVWTCSTLLSPSTTYWVVFTDTSASGSYTISSTAATAGGVGTWLSNPDYDFSTFAAGAWAVAPGTAGALQVAIGAVGTPVITSALTASGTYGTPFTYTITGTGLPTSFSATGLPPGLTLDPATGIITGAPTQTLPFSVALTATNVSGTGPASTLNLNIGKAPLNVTADNQTRAFGANNPAFTISYAGFLNGDTADSLIIAPNASTTANTASPVGSYPISAVGGLSFNYSFNYVAGTLTVTGVPQTITFNPISNTVIGQPITLTAASSSGLPVVFSVVSGPVILSGNTLSATGVGQVTVRASQPGNASVGPAPDVDQSFSITAGLPPTATTPQSGGTVSLSVSGTGAGLAYQWQRNGADLSGATGSTLTLINVQPANAGLYSYTSFVPGGTGGSSDPAILGVSTTSKVIGTGAEIGANIVHPNGNIYDQVLLQGPASTITADANQVTRISFVDLTDDIVQVEFSGAGTLSLVLDNASGPAGPVNYNQPSVTYMKGHAGIVITGANVTSNVSVFCVGRLTAFDPTGAFNITLPVSSTNNPANNGNPIFQGHPVSSYDGVADIAFIAIQSSNGKFGGIRTSNTTYFATKGFTGIYAPGVQFTGPVFVGDIIASGTATPVLLLGSASDTRITGGGLFQSNGQPVRVSGITQLKFTSGVTSQNVTLPVQTNQGVLLQDGVNVSTQIVVYP